MKSRESGFGAISSNLTNPCKEAARMMEERSVGCVLVLSNGKPRGLLTDRDIVLRCVAHNLDVSDTTVENILSEQLATVHETDGIFDCIVKMHSAGVRRYSGRWTVLMAKSWASSASMTSIRLLSQELSARRPDGASLAAKIAWPSTRGAASGAALGCCPI